MRPRVPVLRNTFSAFLSSTKSYSPSVAIASVLYGCAYKTISSLPSRQIAPPRYFSTSSPRPASSNPTSPPWTVPFIKATDSRRSIYALNSSTSAKDSEIVSLAEQCLLTVPSAFNSQTTRMAILFNEDHRKLWDITGQILLDTIGRDRYDSGTGARIEGFKIAHGSILFWDDKSTVDKLRIDGGELYGPKAEEWSHQSNGMHQYYMWTALETFGMGANLQHYNPLIDDKVKEAWGFPEQWSLTAQMVFGDRKEGAVPKKKEQKLEMKDRLKYFGDTN